MTFYKVKKQVNKLITTLATALVVGLLFILQYIVIEQNFLFFKDIDFWANLAIMVAILIIVNEIYWRNGSKRGERNDKYIGSAIEYSVRINRIKNCQPCKTEDFYKYIDEKNIELFIEARNNFLDDNGISKDDYYRGSITKSYNEDGTEIVITSKPHCEMSKSELTNLKRATISGIEEPYYTKKQIRIIKKAICGKFHHEVINSTEILSGIKIRNNKYATSYNAKKNKASFTGTNVIVAVLLSVLGSLLDPKLREEGITAASMFLFMYRLITVVWRAITSDEAGYRDVVETRRGVNINRANIATMYATSRNLNLFEDINTEIARAKAQYLEPEIMQSTESVTIKETKNDGLQS